MGTFKDDINLTTLPLYGDTKAMNVTIEGDDDKLPQLTASIDFSKVTSSSKSTYVSWICYFYEGEGS